MKALVKSRAEPGLVARGGARAGGRHQRRQDPRPRDGDLRHRPPHPPLGRLGPADDPRAARGRARVRGRGGRGRLERERLPAGGQRGGRGPRRVRAVPQLHGGTAPAVRPLDRPRRPAPRRVRRVRRAADDERLAPLGRRGRGRRCDLRPVRQRGAHGARVPRARRGRARHRRRSDRLHGGRGRPARGGASRRRDRPQPRAARARAANGRNARRRPARAGPRATCSASSA